MSEYTNLEVLRAQFERYDVFDEISTDIVFDILDNAETISIASTGCGADGKKHYEISAMEKQEDVVKSSAPKYTKFGEFMRVQRVKNHEVMSDTARLLSVVVPFVSTVENGRRNVPKEWIPLLVEHYNLNAEEQAELQEAVELSKTQVKINLTTATSTQRKLAVLFQHSFEMLDEDTIEAIIKLLRKD